jgi:hypothetical protein
MRLHPPSILFVAFYAFAGAAVVAPSRCIVLGTLAGAGVILTVLMYRSLAGSSV